MAGFGTIGWGLNSWGSSNPVEQTAIPVPFVAEEVKSAHSLGRPVDIVQEDAVFGTLDDFRRALSSSDSPIPITNAHIMAAVDGIRAGTPIARTGVLRDKSWAPDIVPFQRAVTPSIKDLSAYIKVLQTSTKDLSAQILAVGAVFSDSEDLPAFIHGFFEKDLSAYLRAAFPGQDDIGGSIHGFMIEDLPASMQPFHVNNILAILQAVPGEDLPAEITSIPPYNLPAAILSIPSFNLAATAGGHFPEDILAFLRPVPPEDLSASIRGGGSAVDNLMASLNQIGQIQDLGAFIKNAQSGIDVLSGRIRVIASGTKDLISAIHGFVETDIQASIGVFHVSDIRSIVYGYSRENISNLSAVIRRTDTDVLNLPGFIRSQFSAMTGASGFPDLFAALTALDFTLGDIQAAIRGVFEGVKDLTTILNAVSPYINISKFTINLQPLINLQTSLNQVGGFKALSATIKPSVSAATSTAPDARFTQTATEFRFYLGTTSGIFIPNAVPERTIFTDFINSSRLPDLHATLTGWFANDFGASIRPYASSDLLTSIFSYDISHLSHLSAIISGLYDEDLSATINPFGAFTDLLASIGIRGATTNLSASIIPSIDALSTTVLAISTQPYKDLGALINYDSFVRCSSFSTVSALQAFIKPISSGDENAGDLAATLNVLRKQEDLGADLEARKRTRISLISLEFRAGIRDNSAIRATLTPVIPTTNNLAGSIFGLSHTFDLTASVGVVRITPHTVRVTPSERVVNLKTGDEKDIFISFRSQVSAYIYETVSGSLFPTDRGTWSIDLSTLLIEDSFFGLSSSNRSLDLSSVQEYYTLDEAIRAAIVILCERRQQGLGASITAIGAVSSLPAFMGVVPIDKFNNLTGKLFPVGFIPDLSASINTDLGSSGFLGISGIIKAGELATNNDLGAEAVGVYDNNLLASIIAIP